MKSYIVGGWVRDKLLGQDSFDKDWVVVGSTAQTLIDKGFTQVGASFPVFLHPKSKEEYALARKELKVDKGYHGFSVEFSPDVSLKEDLLRRDLTINAMAYDEQNDEIIDPFNGIGDIKAKILNNVSPAFVEDPLRVVRLARFHAMLPDFSISESLNKQVKTIIDSQELSSLAKERVVKEFEKAHGPRYKPHIFWQHCFNWNILKDVFGAGDVDSDAYHNFYCMYWTDELPDASQRLIRALSFYDIVCHQITGYSASFFLKQFSRKVLAEVAFLRDTFFLKDNWTTLSLLKFIQTHRLMHLSKERSFAFSLFKLPMSDDQIQLLVEQLANLDKSSCIDKSSALPPNEQITLTLKDYIENGQFAKFFPC